MFHPAIYENSQPDGMGLLEIVRANGDTSAPERHDGVAPRRFVPLKRSALQGEIVGPLADLHLHQTFGYTRAQCLQTLEALYRFPLPGDAAVTGVTVHFGAVAIVATLAAREAAEAEYATAKQEGRQAVLAKREGPDLFTLQVAGLQPDQEIVVETHYIQLARSTGAGWSVRVPLTTAPRYVRSDERSPGGSPGPVQGQPLALLRDPGHRFALNLRLRGVAKVTSATHPLAVTIVDGDAQVQLQGGEVLPDRDCVLHWTSQQAEHQPHLTLFSHTPPAYAASAQATPDPTATHPSYRYFLAQVAPPRQPQQPPFPREVILLVDHSGSMSGPKWVAADWAVERFLTDLQEQDSFALGIFHNETRWFAHQVQPATQPKTAAAIAWLKQSTDSGGTELGVALEGALRLPHREGAVARHLLILTDAAVTDADRILRLADQERQQATHQGHRRRISLICIDAAPNAFLAQELAERGGGIAKFLTSDPNQEDITTALDEVLTAWAEPLYVNLQLHIHHPQVEMSDQHTILRRTGTTTIVDLGDLAGGQTRWLAGRLPHPITAAVTVDLQVAAGATLAAQPLAPTSMETTVDLQALFGARRVQGLEYLMQAGLPPAQVAEQLQRLGYDGTTMLTDMLTGQATSAPPVYAETARADMTAALRTLLVSEALRYGLASAETAFVATRLEAGQPVQAQVAVANALPAGWSEHFLTPGPPLMRSMAMSAAMPTPMMHLATGMGKRSKLGERMLGESRPASLPSPASNVTSALSGQGRGPVGGEAMVLFRGEARVTAGQALLFSSTTQPGLPEAMTITGIALRLLASFGESAHTESENRAAPGSKIVVDRSLALHLFIGDLASPRARIRLQDLLRHGERPLNLYRAAGQPVELHLVDPTGWLQTHPLTFELLLRW